MFPKSVTEAITSRSFRTPTGAVQFASALTKARRGEAAQPKAPVAAPVLRAATTKIETVSTVSGHLNVPGYKPTSIITTSDPAVVKAIQEYLNPVIGANPVMPGASRGVKKPVTDTQIEIAPQTGSIKPAGYFPTHTIRTTDSKIVDIVKKLTGKPLPSLAGAAPKAKASVARAIEAPVAAPISRAPTTKIEMVSTVGGQLNVPGYKPTSIVTTNDPAIVTAVEAYLNPFIGTSPFLPGASRGAKKPVTHTTIARAPETGSIKAADYFPTYTIRTTDSDLMALIQQMTNGK